MWRIQSVTYSIQHRKPSQVDLAPARVALQNELIQRFSLHNSFTNRVHSFARIVRRELGATLRAFELSFASDLGQIYSVEPDSLHLNLLQYYIGCCESKTLTEHCYRQGRHISHGSEPVFLTVALCVLLLWSENGWFSGKFTDNSVHKQSLIYMQLEKTNEYCIVSSDEVSLRRAIWRWLAPICPLFLSYN